MCRYEDLEKRLFYLELEVRDKNRATDYASIEARITEHNRALRARFSEIECQFLTTLRELREKKKDYELLKYAQTEEDNG